MSKQYPKNRKLHGWAMELSEFDFSIVHIPSKLNSISDCLSRLTHTVSTTITTEELKSHQHNDSDIKAAVEYLSRQRLNFDVNQLGSLKRFRKHLHLSTDNILLWKNKVVIPPCLRSQIFALCHDNASAGHFGIDRTYSKFGEKYFWPHSLSDLTNWIKSCQKCNEFNRPYPSYSKAPLQPIVTDHRFEIVSYDFAGPFLPVTVRGNRYALIVVDHFLHWPEFIALPNAESTTVARALFENWCCRYGIPDRLHK